jgi:hypothetical protein
MQSGSFVFGKNDIEEQTLRGMRCGCTVVVLDELAEIIIHHIIILLFDNVSGELS